MITYNKEVCLLYACKYWWYPYNTYKYKSSYSYFYSKEVTATQEEVNEAALSLADSIINLKTDTKDVDKTILANLVATYQSWEVFISAMNKAMVVQADKMQQMQKFNRHIIFYDTVILL